MVLHIHLRYIAGHLNHLSLDTMTVSMVRGVSSVALLHFNLPDFFLGFHAT